MKLLRWYDRVDLLVLCLHKDRVVTRDMLFCRSLLWMGPAPRLVVPFLRALCAAEYWLQARVMRWRLRAWLYEYTAPIRRRQSER